LASAEISLVRCIKSLEHRIVPDTYGTTKLAVSVSDSVCQDLVGLHAFTEYNSVSAFAGRRKIGAMKLLKGSESFQEEFKNFRDEWDISGEVFDEMQKFKIKMYAASSSDTQVKALRYDLFCAKRGEVESSQLVKIA
jgi:hypothetical protein